MAYFYRRSVEETTGALPSVAPNEAEEFRLAMREFASGVAIVAAGEGERRNGCTATSLCSLSLEPPSLIVCLARSSSTLKTIRNELAFGVSLLAEDQADLAGRFAGRTGLRGAARFEGCDVIALATGAPLLKNAVVMLDCEVEETIERHTHAIVIGRVVSAKALGGRPLLHWRGRSLPPS
jgi:flavin reductase (DIM6/NTAB) family NADH-FMN oxidoreductase RutF